MSVRSFRTGDEKSFQLLVNEAYRNLECLTTERVRRLLSPPYFSPDGFFMSERRGHPVGCVGVFNLPAEDSFEIRYLAVKKAFSNMPVVEQLMDVALKYSVSRRPRFLKAVTLTIQPYVDAYQRFGFKPVRRILRISWDPVKTPKTETQTCTATLVEVNEDDVDEASGVLVDGLKPHWHWWVEEQGGEEAVRKQAAEWMRQSAYLAARVDERIVGVAGVIPHPERAEASFSGVIVLPDFRLKGIGSELMNAALCKAKQMGYKRLVVHTVAYLESLAPGAVLYLKSGGRIEAEYIHLIKEP